MKNKIEDNINEVFSKYDFEGLFEKTKSSIINFLNNCYQLSDEILEKNRNDFNKAIQSIYEEIDKMMNEFKESINDMINKLNNNIELIKKQIIKTINKSFKNTDDKNNQIENTINYKDKDISFNFKETLEKNFRQINAVIGRRTSEGLTISKFISITGAFIFTTLSFILSFSKKNEFKKLIKKIKKKIENGLHEQKNSFIRNLQKLKKNIIVSYKKEIGISCFELNKDEQKDFEDKKIIYFNFKYFNEINFFFKY